MIQREATIPTEAISNLHELGWFLHMLWEDSRGWGATVRDALEGTCEHHATARGQSPEEAIRSAMDRLGEEAFDAPETTTAYADTAKPSAASGLLSLLGLGQSKQDFKKRRFTP